MDARARLDETLQRAGLTSQRCLACDVCCRFASPTASFIPYFSAAEIEALGAAGAAAGHFLAAGRAACGTGALACARTAGAAVPHSSPVPGSAGEQALAVPTDCGCRCPFFEPSAQRCAVYGQRPLDCRLYPFVLMFDREGRAVWLAADEACPFVLDAQGSPEWQQAAAEATALLEGPLAEAVAAAPGLVSHFQDHVRPLHVLPQVTRRVCRSDLGLARLVPGSQEALGDFFRARPSCLTGHAFPAMYLWRDLFHLFWKVEAECLLIFAEWGGVCFLMAPPLGRGDFARALAAARETMAALNGGQAGGRAQEVDEGLLPLFAAAGWQVGHRAVEYIASTDALATLRGRHADGRRHDLRVFQKSYAATWRPYEAADLPQCVALFHRWQDERARRYTDDFYCCQLLDSGPLHLRTLRDAESLGLRGHVVTVDGQVVAYTFGFPLADGQTFADFIEVADLSFRGLPAFVLTRFCQDAAAYPFVNLGTDSELPNLARTKRLYHPCRLEPTYVLNPPETP